MFFFLKQQELATATWRIIPLSMWLGPPPFISHGMAIWKGNNPILRGLIYHIGLHAPTCGVDQLPLVPCRG